MNRIYKAIKAFGITILVLVLFLLIISIVVNSKGNKVEDKINEFKNRSEYVGTYTININKKEVTISYYKVTKEYDYEINDDRRIYSESYTNDNTQKFTDINIGDVGDVYLTNSNPFGLLYTQWMSDKIYIGHAGIISTEDAKKIYESNGNGGDSVRGVHELDNDWFSFRKTDILILRNKSNINKKEIQNWLTDKENLKYNYLYFIKAKNKYYCTDLVTRCYEESINTKIAKNSTLVTGDKIINYDDNFIIYYREKSNDENIDYNVYYLE